MYIFNLLSSINLPHPKKVEGMPCDPSILEDNMGNMDISKIHF